MVCGGFGVWIAVRYTSRCACRGVPMRFAAATRKVSVNVPVGTDSDVLDAEWG